MAQKGSTVEFFSGYRREMEIGEYKVLKTAGGEKRIKFDMRLPISNRPMLGIPGWISEGHELIIKDDSVYDKSTCKGVRLEGMTVTVFSTDTVKSKSILMAGCTMDKFVVQAIGKDDKKQTHLGFVLYAPASKDLAEWSYDHMDATMFAEFDTTQASFSYGGEAEEDELDASLFDKKEVSEDSTKSAAEKPKLHAVPKPKPGKMPSKKKPKK